MKRRLWTDHPAGVCSLILEGSATLFSGPSIRKTSPPGTALRLKDLAYEFQWISFVAIGDIKVTVIGPTGPEASITARRFVYVPKDDRILIDGVPWGPPSLNTRRASPTATSTTTGR